MNVINNLNYKSIIFFMANNNRASPNKNENNSDVMNCLLH